ncbi:hypothetical protein LSH36_99g05024 [Paralvinella palmiformis]|uniref:Polypeptide N-acetylgalactosaminyltransferase n=1 Tax=Paralvinella palmiformis TaxID=53620 RepID=A0AAD9NCQ9_9ANNE|nr:hypothetical protein LSH36_99g05024 [Paralvinella palmiformis]
MVSTRLRMRMRYLGTVRVSRLVFAVGLIFGAILLCRWLMRPSPGIVRYKEVPVEHRMPQQEIDDYIFALQDTRPPHCRLEYRGHGHQEARPKVSILVDFHNAEFYNLKLTLESILKHTPDELYKEIILLDDGSDQALVTRHADEVLRGKKFAKVRAFRSEKYHGRGVTRFKASQVAEGSVLVFVSSDVTVNVGWLEPLLDAISEDYRLLVVSHSENFLSDHRFYQIDDDMVSTFSWTLSTIYTESADHSGRLLRTPVMRGEVVAVSKTFLESIGNYDDGMFHGGGHDFELSLRTWLCGGQVLKSICSRVATHSALKPLVVTNHTNYRRIAELWLGDYKDIAYQQGGVKRQMSADEKLDVDIRRKFLNKKLTCRSLDWYLNNVATNILAPSAEMVHYGKLKVSATYCARLTKELGKEVILVLCRPYLYDPSMIFMLDSRDRIRVGDMCLFASSATSRVILTECQDDNRLQTWQFLDSGLVLSRAFEDTCLTHVTSVDDAKTRVHQIHASACRSGVDPKQIWSFISF